MSSSSSLFKTIAVAGGLTASGPSSASLGSYVARALIKSGANVIVLGRASAVSSTFPSLLLSRLRELTFISPRSQVGSSVAKELASLGATIRSVDYDSPSSLATALEGVEVVISTLAGGGVAAQVPLAEASKAAGVQLFVPG